MSQCCCLAGRLHTRSVAVLALALVVSACGEDATLSATGQTRPDGGADAAVDVPRDGFPDIVVPDATAETQTRGEFLDPCEGDDDCASNFCVQAGDDLVCTEFCTPTSCPEGWSCRILENSGADVARVCVPNPDTFCSPCENNSDCGGFGAACIDVGGDRVCGRDCSEGDETCGEGFFCSTRLDPAGEQVRQCVPQTEQCSCQAAVDGESRACVRQNEFGVCEGTEVCLGEEGWSQCTAATPVEEDCDGRDNDCDGSVDEDMNPQPCFSTPNEIGTCEGTESCEGDEGWICDARQASIEICDGLDNDCDGTADDGLCFDGNPCTLDVCDPENPGGCSYPPNTGACDDGNTCTVNEVCIDGACTGSPRNCDDGNACTGDSCDPVAGCVRSNLSNVPCETGNFCTADICQSGACVQGGAQSCPGANACTNVSCNPATGCQIERLTGNLCDDDDPCTVNDRCSNGSCISGTPFCANQTCDDCPEIGIGLGFCVDLFGPTCLCASLCP